MLLLLLADAAVAAVIVAVVVVVISVLLFLKRNCQVCIIYTFANCMNMQIIKMRKPIATCFFSVSEYNVYAPSTSNNSSRSSSNDDSGWNMQTPNAKGLLLHTHTYICICECSYVCVCPLPWHSFLAATHPQCSSWPNNCAPAALIFGTHRHPRPAAGPIWFAMSTRQCRDDRRSESADLWCTYMCPRWVYADPDVVSRQPNGAKRKQ